MRPGSVKMDAVAPGKTPRSSMSPSVITDQDGKLVLVAGSMGGSTIIASVARSIIGVLDWKQTPQDATGTASVFARTPEIVVEKSRLAPSISEALRGLGWNVVEDALLSGTHLIQVTPQGLAGGADPREEGVAIALPAGK
jgi:gamma-glutamyltranspeptidase / glutathione hydrolase